MVFNRVGRKHLVVIKLIMESLTRSAAVNSLLYVSQSALFNIFSRFTYNKEQIRLKTAAE